MNTTGGRNMGKLGMTAMILLLAVGVAFAGSTITKKAGDYTVAVTLDKDPPIAGKNNVDVAIKDSAGKAVTDAKVVVEYSMPAMSGMGAMNYKSNAGLKGETYKAVIEPSMSGGWNMAVKIGRAGKTETARFALDVK
jgi:hypothetical protein